MENSRVSGTAYHAGGAEMFAMDVQPTMMHSASLRQSLRVDRRDVHEIGIH